MTGVRARSPRRGWMSVVLIAAGMYNLIWGGAVVGAPSLFFDLVDLAPPRYPQIWQTVGMIVGVYGVGYLIAATDPLRHWPIVLVGFLGKTFGPIGFASALAREDLPLAFGATIVTNDLIWWPFFLAILLAAASNSRASGSAEMDRQPVVGD